MSSNPKSRGGRRAYDPAVKAAALAALLAGQAMDHVAKEYNLPIGTIKGWRSKTANGAHAATIGPNAKLEIGDLLLGYLRENLATLKHHQATVFRDTAWLTKQNAADLGVLHGIITDKAIRLLESMAAAGIVDEEPQA